MNIKFIIHHSSFIIRKSRGFTLIELLIAIAIIGILSSFLLANFVGIKQRSRDGVRKSDIRQIQSALELYRSDKESYPTTGFPPACAGQFDDGETAPVVYVKKFPCDPSGGTSYFYSSDGTTYSLTACLENSNDSQKDNPVSSSCSSTGVSYTVQNP